MELVDAGRAKELDLRVVVPLEDMREPGEGSSIWPSIYPALLELVQEHRSTILFVNNRRLAERLALRLNELAEREIARAHHGSLAREQRVEVEELLKKGEIPVLVATSSLELGIDMGAVDLVIQVESPKSVARGLQRIGRAGHRLDEPSKGRIFPKFRADLLESAVVVQRMREGLIEETQIPRNPPGSSSRTSSTCWPAAIPRKSSPSSAPASPGTGSAAWCADAKAHGGSRSRMPGRSRTGVSSASIW
jgi:ATP-dependent Lhr-like helicase